MVSYRVLKEPFVKKLLESRRRQNGRRPLDLSGYLLLNFFNAALCGFRPGPDQHHHPPHTRPVSLPSTGRVSFQQMRVGLGAGAAET